MSTYAVVILVLHLTLRGVSHGQPLIFVQELGGSLPLIERDVLLSAANITAVACSGVARIGTDDGFILSPNYGLDQNYPSNSNCTWIIQAPAGKVVKVTVQTLVTQKKGSSCRDRLLVYDYPGHRGAQLTKLCGTAALSSDAPRATIYSRSSGIYINFLSGSVVNMAGFQLKYDFVDAFPGCYNGQTEKFTAPSGKINSPYPELGFYPNGCKCKWLIVAPKYTTILLTVIEFFIQDDSAGQCNLDRVVLRDGGFGAPLLTPPLCGRLQTQNFETTKKKLAIAFHSNIDTVKTGFHIAWRFKKDGHIVDDVASCPGSQPMHLNESNGYISSPTANNSDLYSNGLNCRWQIQVPDGEKVFMNFTRFSLEERGYGIMALLRGRCLYDAVDLYDGDTATPSAQLASFCGSDLPPSVTSTGSKVHIVFRSDIALTARGFRLHYRAVSPPGQDVCGVPQITPKALRVVGGTEALKHSWPWQVGLTLVYNGGGSVSHVCGGSVIHRRWIVTAAHCIPDPAVGSVEVYVGGHDTVKRLREQNVAIERTIVHSDFDLDADQHDIALIELKSNLTFDSTVAPVCIAAEDVQPGTMCIATGWGITLGTGTAQVLRQVNLPILSDSTCHQWYKESLNTTINLCAGYKTGGKDTCNGDSGGPLVCQQDGVWRQHGITSNGEGCAQPEHPGTYIRVSAYRDWIHTQTGGDVTVN